MRSMLKLSIAPFFATLALVSLACGDDTATGGGGTGGTPSSGGGGQGAGAGPQGGNGNGGDGGSVADGGRGEGGTVTNGGNGGTGGDGGTGGEGGSAPDGEQAYFFGDFATDMKNDVATVSFPGGTPTVFALDGFATGDDLRSLAVSPDGSQIAIAAQDQPGGMWTLNLYASDGTGTVTTLVTAANADIEIEQLAFSKDGAWIAYRSDVTFNGGNELWVVPTAGGAAKRVSQAMTTADNDVSSYAWRADSAAGSEYLAYQADPGTNNAFGLFTVDVMAANPAPVAIVPEATASQAVAQGVPAFDSQGRVYFRSDFEVDNVFRLYRANIDGTMRAQVAGTSLTNANGEASTGAVGITPDGSTLVFGSDSPTANLYQLYALDLSGNTADALTDVAAGLTPAMSTGPDFAPAIQFSPDGTLAAVRADWPVSADAADNDWSVFVVPLDGSGATRIFAVPMGVSQDVEEVVFSANSARLFVRGDLVTNNDNIVVSTTDFTTPDQSAATATLQGVVTDGDVNGLVAAP